ncbi:YegS/Rv2252/BmrU family lipid kinase [Nocardioides luteus]|uniref:Lipid kinase n=1 Tax=Nocardioides luteus TaxID=1844 RepID=A0ABQ5SZ56_9ACTN|nr:lipid kinase [Nocardioides luteus]MDR7310956.1 YegS/Rv2252/BmrU family lipid kinase [Nocardioides luteus]GGR39513.1 lipid kinase [Nocardioides luteus]GLJ69264.1 lipid kinase [Nocardioides luteus]
MQTLLSRDSLKVALVVNAGSRRGEDALASSEEKLRSAGIEDVRTYAVRSGDELEAALDEVAAAKPDLLVIGGGDGSVSAAAGRIANTDVVLAVIPLGTANDFARTLELELEPEAAIEQLLEGKVINVDVGRANGHAYLNVASFGLSVAVTEALSSGMKKVIGPAAYPVATVKAYREHTPFTARLEFPEGDHETVEFEDLLQVAVGNGRHYGGGHTVSPSASLDDDLLDVYAIMRGKMSDHVSILRLLKSGHFVEHEQVHHTTTRAVRVTTDEPMPVNLDGELLTETPTDFTVESNALHVAVPMRSRAGRLDGPPPDARDERAEA